MTTISEAVELVKQQARVFQAVIAIGDYLNGCRDLEAQKNDTQEAVDALVKTRGTLLNQIGDAEAYLGAVNDEIVQANREHADVDTALIAMRKAAAQDASSEGERILAEAKRLADVYVADVEQARQSHVLRLAQWEAEEDAARDRTLAVEAHLAELRAKFGE